MVERREEEPREPLKPLTTWEKVKIGAKGFVKTAIEYIPRGLLFSGLAMAGSAGLGAAFGPKLDFFSVLSHPEMIPVRMGFSMLLGGAISGGVGAWQAVKEATRDREDAIIAEGDQLRRGRQNGPERQRETGFTMSGTPQPGLPRAAQSQQPAPGFR